MRCTARGESRSGISASHRAKERVSLPIASTASYKNTTYQANTFTPDVNIGNGGTWTLSFTLQNETSATLDIDAISFGIFTFNNDGVSQANNTSRDLILTLGGDFGGTASYTHQGSNTGSLISKPLTLQKAVSVAVGDSVDFSLNVQEGVSLGTFVGLKSITFSTPNIPEPTTATLSLLALAGLAARRR